LANYEVVVEIIIYSVVTKTFRMVC